MCKLVDLVLIERRDIKALDAVLTGNIVDKLNTALETVFLSLSSAMDVSEQVSEEAR